MDLGYRHALSNNGLPTASLVPRTGIRNNPAYDHQPVTGFDFSSTSPDMEKQQQSSIAKKRRGGSRKACDECKQQKVGSNFLPSQSLLAPES